MDDDAIPKYVPKSFLVLIYQLENVWLVLLFCNQLKVDPAQGATIIK